MKSELKGCTVECRSEGDPASAGELDAKLDTVFDAGSSDLAKTRRAVIHETIELLNDDDVRELFKATLTSLSLVQDCQSITGLPGHSETQIPT